MEYIKYIHTVSVSRPDFILLDILYWVLNISEICTARQIHSQSTSYGYSLHGQKYMCKSFRSLTFLLHTERENVLNDPSITSYATPDDI